MGIAEPALSSAERLHPSCKLCTAILESLRGLRKFLTVRSSGRNAIHLNSVPPLLSPPRRGRCKRGSLDSSLVAAFAALGPLRFYFAAVLSYRFPDSSSSEKS